MVCMGWQIWEDILGFENCEFYIERWPQLDGITFDEVLISFPEAIPCGVKAASYGGKIILNPDDSYVLQEGDEVLVIAEDDDTYAPAALPTVLPFSLQHRDSINVPFLTSIPSKFYPCQVSCCFWPVILKLLNVGRYIPIWGRYRCEKIKVELRNECVHLVLPLLVHT